MIQNRKRKKRNRINYLPLFSSLLIGLLLFQSGAMAEEPWQFLIPGAGFSRIEESHGTAFALAYQLQIKKSSLYGLLSFKYLNTGEKQIIVSPALPAEGGELLVVPETPVGKVGILSLGVRYGKYFYLAPRLNLVSGNKDFRLGWGITGGLQVPIGKRFSLGYRLEYDRGGQNYRNGQPIPLESYSLLFEIYLPLQP